MNEMKRAAADSKTGPRVTVKKAIYSVVGLAMLLAAPQAMAAAGVEEASLAELRQLIVAQQRQLEAQAEAIKALQAGQGQTVGATEAGQGKDGVATPLAKVVTKGSDRVSLALYGQVNRAVMFADDGKESEVFHVDNDGSSTRVGMKGAARATDDLSAGFKFEVEFEGNSSNDVSMNNQDTDASFKKRHMDLYLQSKQLGKLSLGQGDTASNGTSEVDLSGTTVIGFSDQPKLGGSLTFYDQNSNSSVATRIKDVVGNMDGLSRRDRLRYDSPTFYGLAAAVSTVERNGNDVALRYSGKIGATKLAAAAAYARMGDNAARVDSTINGSVSVLFGNGLNATLAAGRQDLDQPAPGHDDPLFWYAKLGYITSFFGIGSTAFAVDYGNYQDFALADDTAETFGVMAVQRLDNLGTELYASYRRFSLDREGLVDMADIDLAMAGARIKF